MRAHMTWVTIRTNITGNIVHSGRYPQRAPASEYMKIPPASLSATAVMNPGPKTARKTIMRCRRFFSMAFPVHSLADFQLTNRRLVFGRENADHVIRRDDAAELSLFIHGRAG